MKFRTERCCREVCTEASSTSPPRRGLFHSPPHRNSDTTAFTDSRARNPWISPTRRVNGAPHAWPRRTTCRQSSAGGAKRDSDGMRWLDRWSKGICHQAERVERCSCSQYLGGCPGIALGAAWQRNLSSKNSASASASSGSCLDREASAGPRYGTIVPARKERRERRAPLPRLPAVTSQ